MGPYHAKCRVLALSDGEFAFSGAMYAGATARLADGPGGIMTAKVSACLSAANAASAWTGRS